MNQAQVHLLTLHTKGPPNLATTRGGEDHRALRKALSNGPWTMGLLKKTWESRFDELIMLFITKLHEHAEANRVICISDKLTQFAADVLSMIAFSAPFGSIKNQRDERNLITNFRQGLPAFGFAGRFKFYREKILTLPILTRFLLPSVADESGMGWLVGEADRQVTAREQLMAEGKTEGKQDLLQK
jgi:hypothetical protein